MSTEEERKEGEKNATQKLQVRLHFSLCLGNNCESRDAIEKVLSMFKNTRARTL